MARHNGPAVMDGEVATSDVAQNYRERLPGAPRDLEVSGLLDGRIDGVVVGTIVGFADAGASPLVTFAAQPGTAALRARATVDLHGTHVGKAAVMMFENGDPHRPIIVGCLRQQDATTLQAGDQRIDVEADDERLVVSAKERIVLRCGQASITLTKDGKIILQGAYLSSRSSGVLRIRGGSVQIN